MLAKISLMATRGLSEELSLVDDISLMSLILKNYGERTQPACGLSLDNP